MRLGFASIIWLDTDIILVDEALAVGDYRFQTKCFKKFEELKEIVGDIDGVVVGVDTWNEEVFRLAPKLKVLARFGVGVDNIDLKAAEKREIVVCNSPGINSSAVAEQAAALIFSSMRQIPQMNNAVRDGKWPRPMFHELKSRTIGFLGFGRNCKKSCRTSCRISSGNDRI